MLSADATRLGIGQQKVVVASLQTALHEAKTAQSAEVRKRDSIAQELSQMAVAMKDMLRSREHVQQTAQSSASSCFLSLTETETDGEDSLPPLTLVNLPCHCLCPCSVDRRQAHVAESGAHRGGDGGRPGGSTGVRGHLSLSFGTKSGGEETPRQRVPGTWAGA